MKKLSLLQLSTLILIVIFVLIYILKPKEVENLEFKCKKYDADIMFHEKNQSKYLFERDIDNYVKSSLKLREYQSKKKSCLNY